MDEAPSVHAAVAETATAIDEMEVRGAAAIADAVAAALATAARESEAEGEALRAELRAAAARLHGTRPTAITLGNALREVLGGLDGSPEGLRARVVDRAAAFREDLADAQAAVGRVGGNRLADGDTIVTHCHSTAAVACVEHAVEHGRSLSAIVTETRPRLQGHETARDLRDLGVPATVVVDGAANRVLADADRVLVGADSIAADGTVVNKVGTATLAVCAAARDVPVLVAASTYKCNPETLAGGSTPIEERPAEEVLDPATRAALGDPEVANPAFDRTPAAYVDAIATEAGLVPPAGVTGLLRDRYGADPPRPWT